MAKSWVVVVPVKRLDVAKSRLSAHLGAHRRELALAMALDTVSAAAACDDVRVVVVADDDPVVHAFLALGVKVVADEPRAGINTAVVHAAAGAALRPYEGVAALTADLPALRTAELARALERAPANGASFVADADGTGTTLYAAPGLASFVPEFGPGSAARHATQASPIDAHGLTGLRRDVDTIDDLRVAVGYGVGPRTEHVIARFVDLDPFAIRPAS